MVKRRVSNRMFPGAGRQFVKDWYPDQELNLDPSFRKRLLYPFELSGRERLTAK